MRTAWCLAHAAHVLYASATAVKSPCKPNALHSHRGLTACCQGVCGFAQDVCCKVLLFSSSNTSFSICPGGEMFGSRGCPAAVVASTAAMYASAAASHLQVWARLRQTKTRYLLHVVTSRAPDLPEVLQVLACAELWEGLERARTLDSPGAARRSYSSSSAARFLACDGTA
jgi:hypothetical protein